MMYGIYNTVTKAWLQKIPERYKGRSFGILWGPARAHPFMSLSNAQHWLETTDMPKGLVVVSSIGKPPGK